ncbi:hypothetical protein [Bradyrhizobium phage BDU-MI-1]|nr:hypothetical protein [Bradyrhizobium phage BDU-MI-1]
MSAAANDNELRQMLSWKQLLAKIPLSRSAIEKKIKEGTFPKPRPLTPMKLGFYLDEVVEWQKSLDDKAA